MLIMIKCGMMDGRAMACSSCGKYDTEFCNFFICNLALCGVDLRDCDHCLWSPADGFFTDFRGQVIQAGDAVAVAYKYGVNGGARLYETKIIGFTPKMVVVIDQFGREKLIKPTQVVKL